jgi:flavodoxin
VEQVVVVYYSRTGKTRAVAERLAELLSAEIEEIRETRSREGIRGALSGGWQAFRKRSSQLASKHFTAGRAAVVLGMPVWAGGPPPAVRAYVEHADLTGRDVFVFYTHDGGPGGIVEKLEAIVPGGLSGTLGLKKPAKDADLDAKLTAFAEQIRGLVGDRHARPEMHDTHLGTSRA